jgi:hypothetical protein
MTTSNAPEDTELRNKIRKMVEGISVGYHGEDGIDYIMNLITLHTKEAIKKQQPQFVLHHKSSKVQKLDEKHISITTGGISFGKTRPSFERAVIEYDRQNSMIRFHEPNHEEYGISYKVGINPNSGVFGFRARPFEGFLPHGYYYKVSNNTYQLTNPTEREA